MPAVCGSLPVSFRRQSRITRGFVLAESAPAREDVVAERPAGKGNIMSLAASPSSGGFAELAALEKALLGRVHAAGEVLKRTECLDEEQRAEIHAILEAIRHDSESHAAVVASLPAEPCHA